MIAKIVATFRRPVQLLLGVLVLLVKIYFIFLWKICRIFIPKSIRFSDGSLQADLILVTGCGNSLSRHVVLKLAEMGASLVLWDNDKEAVRSVAEEAESYGTQVYPFVCDCSDQDVIYSTAKKVQQEVGNISILINNLSVSTAGKDIMSMDDARLAQVMKTNFYSSYWVCDSCTQQCQSVCVLRLICQRIAPMLHNTVVCIEVFHLTSSIFSV